MIEKEIQRKIINEIKKIVVLPTKGIVAGQSVASLAYKYLNKELNPVINDVDVFIESIPYSSQKVVLSPIVLKNNLEAIPSDITNVKTKRGLSYSVLSSIRDDTLLNTIKFQVLANGSNILRYNRAKLFKKTESRSNLDCNSSGLNDYDTNGLLEIIVNSFDINCCSIGFDIETERFYWNKSFEEFIKTRKLKVLSCHSPFPTILRLNKKSKELNTKKEIDDEIKVLLTYNEITDSCLSTVGDIFRNRLEKDENKVKDLIKIKTTRKMQFKNSIKKYDILCASDYAFEKYSLNKDKINEYKIVFDMFSHKSFINFIRIEQKDLNSLKRNEEIILNEYTEIINKHKTLWNQRNELIKLEEDAAINNIGSDNLFFYEKVEKEIKTYYKKSSNEKIKRIFEEDGFYLNEEKHVEIRNKECANKILKIIELKRSIKTNEMELKENKAFLFLKLNKNIDKTEYNENYLKEILKIDNRLLDLFYVSCPSDSYNQLNRISKKILSLNKKTRTNYIKLLCANLIQFEEKEDINEKEIRKKIKELFKKNKNLKKMIKEDLKTKKNELLMAYSILSKEDKKTFKYKKKSNFFSYFKSIFNFG